MKRNIKQIVVMGIVALAVGGLAYAAQNYKRASGTINYTNPGAAIANEEVIDLGNQYGVAISSISSGAVGVVYTSGVFEFDAYPTAAISVGEALYWDSATTSVTDTATADTFIGQALTARADTNSAGMVEVDLNVYSRPAATSYVFSVTLQRGSVVNLNGTTNSLVVTNAIITQSLP